MENRIIEFDLYYMYLIEKMAWSQNDKLILVLYAEYVWYAFTVVCNEYVCRYSLTVVY